MHRRLADDTACGGKQAHNANVVATMVVHGIGAIVTINLEDSARLAAHVELIGLSA